MYYLAQKLSSEINSLSNPDFAAEVTAFFLNL